MNEPTRKLRSILERRAMTTAEFSYAMNISLGSLYNLTCGTATSLRTRQRITDMLQTQLWSDVPIRARRLVFWPGSKIESPTIALAKQTALAVPGFAIRDGRSVHFTKLVSVLVPRSVNSL